MMLREMDEMPRISRQAIGNEVERIVQAVDAGEINALDAVAFVTAVEAMAKDAKAKIMEAALEEFAKHGEKELEWKGAKISQMEAGVRYDYSNDPVWAEVKAEENAWAEQRKEVEATLKTLKRPTEMQEGDTMVTRMPPVKTSTTTLKVTIR